MHPDCVSDKGKRYEIEMSLNIMVTTPNDLVYRQGFQDGIKLIKQTKYPKII